MENIQPAPPAERKRFSIKEWWRNHKPSKRRLIQVYAALLANANIKGYVTGNILNNPTKTVCTPGLNCYSCPGAVAACPLGALQNGLAQSDTRAPYYVLGILCLWGITFARTICGFFCPVGLGQELLYKIKTPKLKKNRVTRVLSYFKYILLAVFVMAIPLIYGFLNGVAIPAFCEYICPSGTFGGSVGLLANPKNGDYYAMLGGLFNWKFCVLAAVMVASVFIYRVFCRFLCPLGAIYGFFNRYALLGVRLDKDKCTDCGLCVEHCKMDIKRVGDHECINCGECISVCPAQAISWKGSQIFVHANAVQAAPAVAEEAETSITTAYTADNAAPAETETAPAAAEIKEKKRRKFKITLTPKRELALKIAAIVTAGLVLVGALVYFNFIDKEYEGKIYAAGDVCEDFTLQAYNGEEDFTLSEHRGKTVVINFWATWCSSCVTELPGFERISREYRGEVDVVAIHSSNITVNPRNFEGVQNYINSKTDAEMGDWSGWNLTFAQDSGSFSESVTYNMLGGSGPYPMTVIVDEGGVIRYAHTGNLSYEELDKQIGLVRGNVLKPGDVCADFTLPAFNGKTEFSLSANSGKIVVLDFWSEQSDESVANLEVYERIQKEYPDAAVVAVHQGTDLQDLIDSKGWNDWGLTFAGDEDGKIYKKLGGSGVYPRTVILSADGVIRYMGDGALSYDLLRLHIGAL